MNGGLGTPRADGLMCTSGAGIRLRAMQPSGGSSAFGRASGDSIAAIGQVPAAGSTRFYQVLYRDSANYCTPGTFNLTNGVRIEWKP